MAAKKTEKIDTKALLDSLDIVEVIGKYVPLKKAGKDYVGNCPFHTEKSPSFTVSPTKQFYNCFGCDANGDAIKFVQEYENLSFLDAVKRLGGHVPDGDSSQPVGPIKKPARQREEEVAWLQVVPVPDDAPDAPLAHPYRGKPQMKWSYRDGAGLVTGYVYRFQTTDGGKETIPLCYMEHPETHERMWRWHSFNDPRPLYGLDQLAKHPDSWVLLVEGEKCAEAADIAFSIMDKRPVVITWPGGSKAIDKVDWAPLKGCNVILWPDCDAKKVRLTKAEKDAIGDDESAIEAAQQKKPLLPELEQPGVMAMERIAHDLLRMGEGTRARIVNIPKPGERPDGWDIYDAINVDGYDLQALQRMCTNLRDPFPIETDNSSAEKPASNKKTRSQKGAHTPSSADAEEEPNNTSQEGDWYSRLVRKKGDIVDCLANVYDMLSNVPQWQGVLGFDESAQSTVKLIVPPYAGGAAGEWSDEDDTRTAMWLSRRFHTTPSTSVISKVVDVLSREHSYHPIREWLESLEWDGTKRLNTWVTEWLGVESSPYTKRVSRWFPMGMVARAMVPGCQLDYCLVLEGDQGLRKSSILRDIGGKWFGDTDLDLHNKDSMDALRGKWLYEFAEMGSLMRTESFKQKSFITRRIDEFRPSYGTRTKPFPRQVVFCGTVNEWEWNKDPTGGRRFWPIRVTRNLDTDSFLQVRDQLFAEAVVAWKSGERYWPTPDEQKKLFDPQQLRRMIQDSYIDTLAEWLETQYQPFTLAYAMAEGLKLDSSKQSRDAQTRTGAALMKLGCLKKERRNDSTRFVYEPPERTPDEKLAHQQAQQESEDDHVPF